MDEYHGASELKARVAGSIEELRTLVIGGEVDILLMDIVFDEAGYDGIEFVCKHVPPNSGMQVIYITGYDEYHSDVYRTQHSGFLLKPVQHDDLDEALDLAIERIAKFSEKPFWVRTASGEKVISPSHLRYAESSKRTIRLHVGNDVVETYGKLSDLIRKLPARFVQCHKSFVVNMGFIDEFGRTEITLTSGEKVPVSQKRRAIVRAAFFDYVGRSL